MTIGSLTNTATNIITNTGTSAGASTATTPGSPALTDALFVATASTTASIPALITDGPTRKTQVILTNANLGATFSLTNTGNTFSGGIVLASSGAGTRLDISGAPVVAALGTGPIIIGQDNTDKAGLFFAVAATLNNPIVFNTALGTDRVGLRADAAATLNGVITANLAPATFTSNSGSGGIITVNNQITGANGVVLDITSLAAAATSFNVILNSASPNLNNYSGNTVINLNAANGKSATLNLAAADQIPNGAGKGDVIINSNASGIGMLNLAGFDETINGLNGSGTVEAGTGTPTLTLGDNNATASFSGILQNNGGTLTVTKIGTGTQTLSGASTFAGPLNVSAGTVAFATSPASSGPLGNSTVVNLSGGSISYTATGTNDLGRPLAIGASSGTVNVASSTGTLTIGTVTSTGGNLIKTGPGVLQLTSPGALGTAGVVVNGGTLMGGYGTNGIGSINVAAAGNLSFQNGAADVLTLAGTGSLTLASGANLGFDLGAPGSSDQVIYNTASVTPGSAITLNFFNLGALAGGNYTLLSSSTLGGLAGVNFGLGSAPLGFNYAISNNGTTVSLLTAAYTPIYWGGAAGNSWATAGNFTSDPAGLTPAGHTPLATETVIFNTSGVVGPGVTTTLDGNVTVDSLQFNGAGSPAVSTVSIDQGTSGTLTLKPASSSGGIAILAGGGSATITAPMALSNTLSPSQTWSVTDATSTLAITGNVNFGANVKKTGAGTLILGGNNTGAGNITLTAGSLQINSATALGTGTLAIGAGTTIDNASAADIAMTSNNAISIAGDFTFTGTKSLAFGTGAVTLTNNPTVSLAANTLTFGGVIGGASSLTKTGLGSMTLNGNNTFTGGLNFTGGSLNLGHVNAIGTGTFTATDVTIDNTSGVAMTLNNNPVVLSGAITFTNSKDMNLGAGGVTFAAASTVTIAAGTLTLPGAISGAGNFTKTGPGTLVLSGTNPAYTGTISSNLGVVNLSGNYTAGGLGANNTVDLKTVLNFTGTGSFATTGFNINVGSVNSGTGSSIVNIGPGMTMTTDSLAGANGSLNVANATGGVGVINQTGGTVAADAFFLAQAATGPNSAYGFYNQSGGSFTQNNLGNTSRFRMANSTGSNVSLYYLSGGTSTLGLALGSGSSASIELVSSGSVSTTGGSPVGVMYITGTGQMTNLNPAGSFNIGLTINTTTATTATGQLTIGGAGSTSAGLTTTTVNTSSSTAGAGNQGNSTINLLSGGTLTTGNIVKNANGTSILNFNGGTLKVGTTGTTVAAGITAYAYSNVNIDMNGVAAYTVASPILAPAASGVSDIAITDGGLGYVGAPAVLISGGSGTGATAIAQISGGAVSSIVITNPGTGYQPGDALTYTLLGGGATTPATLGTASFVTNTSGGLTKLNGGNLILAGTNTYTGPTIINAGGLQLGSAGTTGSLSPSSDITFGSGVTFSVNRTNAVVQGTDFSAAPLTGNLAVSNLGSGSLNLNVANNYTGITTISAGSIIVGDGATSGTFGPNAISLTGTGAMVFNRTDNYALTATNLFTGTGSVVVNSGTVTAAVDNQFALTGSLAFGSANATTTTGTLDLTASTNTVGSIVARTDSATANILTIGAGKTLTLTGAGGITVGWSIGTATQTATTKLTINGGGSLVVNNPSAIVSVGIASSVQLNSSTSNTLNLSALSNVNLGTVAAPIATLNVAFGQNAGGALILSNTANTIAATTINVGNSNGSNGGVGSITLGTGTNVIAADTINIGISKIDGTVKFAAQTAGSPGTLTLSDKAGTGGANITVGFSNTGTGASFTGTLDLRGHVANVTANSLVIGNTAIANTGSASGVVSFDTGTFTAAALSLGLRSAIPTANSASTATLNIGGGNFTVTGATTIAANTATAAFASNLTSNLNLTAGNLTLSTIAGASKTGATNTGVSTGNINVSGGTMTVTGASFVLASQASAGTAVGLLNITGGSVTTSADITDGGGAATTTITLDVGTLDMTGHNIGSATPIDALNFQSGTLKNVNQINNGAALSKITTGTLTLAGNTFTGPVNVTAGTVRLGSNNGLGFGGVVTSAAAAGTIVTDAAALDLNGNTAVNETITLNGAGIAGAGALVNSNAAPASISSGVAHTALTTATGAASSTMSATGGGGTGATATANLSLTASTFTVATPGAGYSAVATATVAGGAPATAGTVTALMGVTASTFSINGGTIVYTVAPTVTISGGGGTGATATAILTAGVVTGINITNAGSGFTSAPTIAFSGGTGGAGTAPTGTGSFTNLIVAGITVAPGSGYTSVPTSLTFSGPATTQATANVNANSLLINSITLTSAGLGYTSAPTFANGTAVITPTLSGVILASDSSIGGVGDITINGIVSQSGGARSLTKVGANTLFLNGPNTYTGGTLLNGGTLNVGSAEIAGVSGPLGNPAVPANSIGFAGGTLQYSAANQFDYSGRFSNLTAQPISIDTNSQNVTFASAITNAASTLAKSGAGTLTLTNTNTYDATTITGGTLQVGDGTTVGTLGLGAVTVTSPGIVAFNHSDPVTIANTITGTGGLSQVGGGTTTVNTTLGYTGPTVITAGRLAVSGSIAGSSSVTVANTATFEAAATQTVKSLIVQNGGTAEISGAALKVLTVNALSITGPTGNLNLHTNAMVVNYTGTSPLLDPSPTGIRAAIIAAYNGGDWLGKGIGSTEIAASIGSSKRLAVGFVEASDLLGPTGGNWNLGQSVTSAVDGTAVLVRTTLAGDADLSGDVGLNDLLRLANHYGLATSPTSSWYDGDFDYSGDVGLNDLLQLANNYGQAMPGSAIPSSSPQFAADMQLAFELAGQGVTSVPEPTGLGFAALAAAAALLRRNRGRQRKAA